MFGGVQIQRLALFKLLKVTAPSTAYAKLSTWYNLLGQSILLMIRFRESQVDM
jgi:hypothetical protein